MTHWGGREGASVALCSAVTPGPVLAALAGGVLASGRSGLATFWKLVKRNATVRSDDRRERCHSVRLYSALPPVCPVLREPRGGQVRKDEQLPSAVDKKRKSEMPETFMFLGLAWASSGYVGQAVDLLLCALAIAGVPLTLGTSRVLQASPRALRAPVDNASGAALPP